MALILKACEISRDTYIKFKNLSRNILVSSQLSGMAAGKLRNILGSMEFGRRNLAVDAPVCKSCNTVKGICMMCVNMGRAENIFNFQKG